MMLWPVLESSDQSIDMLLTDLVLPGIMQGNELVQAARRMHPHLALLYMSGYAQDTVVHDGRVDEGLNYLPKALHS